MRTITIKVRPNNTPQPDDLYYDGSKKISSTWVQGMRDIKRGLTREEEKKLLPPLLGVSENDPKFNEEVRKFWANLEIPVPQKGVELNIEMDKDGVPVNLRDYVSYRFALADNRVAKSEKELRENQLTKWWIDDPDARLNVEHENLKKHKRAMKEYLKISDDPGRIDWMLLIMGITDDPPMYHNVETMTPQQKDIALEVYTRNRPDDFVQFAADEHLQMKAGIESAVSRGIFDKQGGSYYYGDTKLGNDLVETVRFLNDKANSKILLLMKETLSIFSADMLSATTQKEIRKTKAKTKVSVTDDASGDEPGGKAGPSES